MGHGKYQNKQHEDNKLIAEGVGKRELWRVEIAADAKSKNAHHTWPDKPNKCPSVEHADKNAHYTHAQR